MSTDSDIGEHTLHCTRRASDKLGYHIIYTHPKLSQAWVESSRVHPGEKGSALEFVKTCKCRLSLSVCVSPDSLFPVQGEAQPTEEEMEEWIKQVEHFGGTFSEEETNRELSIKLEGSAKRDRDMLVHSMQVMMYELKRRDGLPCFHSVYWVV